ncbi:MAG: ROK family protein [Verrucomicrobiota bacterium]|nr:ROK family protein [Limisphaera sp.]MDW8382577.1 ROK family protein [Verrucomicrobiota bacterium]
MATNNATCWVGVDLGGTKILAGVFDARLKLLGTAKVSTRAERGVETVLERIERCVREALEAAGRKLLQVKAVGIGAPGAVDGDRSTVLFAPNLPGWRRIPLGQQLAKALERPVVVGNDANVCTLGVHEVEWNRQPRHLVGIFVGTGIGGGLILDGRLYEGASFTAAEVGHMILEVNGPKCGCGNRGCWEALASRTAIYRRLREAVETGEKTVLTEWLGPELTDLRSNELRKAWEQDDKLVHRILLQTADYLGLGVANLVNLLNPEVVVLGGGLLQALGEALMPRIVETARQCIIPGSERNLKIVPSRLGDEAGIIGAAVLARLSHDNNHTTDRAPRNG